MPGVGDWVRSIEPLMPRYFFHVHDRLDQLDTEGVELLDPQEARAQAVIATGEALRRPGRRALGRRREWRMTVTDLRGNIVCVIRVTGARQPLA